ARHRGVGAAPETPREDRRLRVRDPDRRDPPCHPPRRLAAARRARSHALPRRDGVGDPPRRPDGRRDASDPARRAPRRAHERPAAGPPRHGSGGDRMSERAPLLELQGVCKSCGGLRVISELDMQVREGEIVSVIGPNGAGKTTLFNLITGIFRPDSGDIVLDGRSIVGLYPHQITKRGVARTFQTLRLFLNMTVKENVMAAQYGRTRSTVLEAILRLPRARREEREIARIAEEKLAFFGNRLMGYRWDQPAYSLSYANRRRL